MLRAGRDDPTFVNWDCVSSPLPPPPMACCPAGHEAVKDALLPAVRSVAATVVCTVTRPRNGPDGRARTAQHRADAIAQEARIGIAAIESRRDVALAEKALDLRSRNVEHRTDDAVVANGMNPAKRGDAATGHETHQHRLGLIVLLMRGGDQRVACDLPQPRMPHLARRRFDSSMPNRLGIQRPIGNAQRNVVPRA